MYEYFQPALLYAIFCSLSVVPRQDDILQMYFSEIATNPESNQQQQHQRQTPTADFVNHPSYYDSFASQAAVMSHHHNRPQMASSNDDHHHVYAVPARVRSV